MKKIFFILLLLPLFLLSSCKGECDFKITFFNVGKADAILIQDKNTNIIIDTGTEESCDYFLEGLKKLNIKEIDCLILSHFDQDHVGGAAKLLTTYDVKQIYQTYLVKTSKTYLIVASNFEREIPLLKEYVSGKIVPSLLYEIGLPLAFLLLFIISTTCLVSTPSLKVILKSADFPLQTLYRTLEKLSPFLKVYSPKKTCPQLSKMLCTFE